MKQKIGLPLSKRSGRIKCLQIPDMSVTFKSKSSNLVQRSSDWQEPHGLNQVCIFNNNNHRGIFFFNSVISKSLKVCIPFILQRKQKFSAKSPPNFYSHLELLVLSITLNTVCFALQLRGKALWCYFKLSPSCPTLEPCSKFWRWMGGKDYCCSVSKLWPTLCDPMNSSTPGFPLLHCLLEFAQTCLLSQWCHPVISSSVAPFSSYPQSLPSSVFFPVSQLFTSGG